MDLLDIDRFLCFERLPLCSVFVHLGAAIYHVSGLVDGNAATSCTVDVLGYVIRIGFKFMHVDACSDSLLIGTIPMGLATIINMIAFVCAPAWGYHTTMLCWALWWIDVVVALSCCMYLPFVV